MKEPCQRWQNADKLTLSGKLNSTLTHAKLFARVGVFLVIFIILLLGQLRELWTIAQRVLYKIVHYLKKKRRFFCERKKAAVKVSTFAAWKVNLDFTGGLPKRLRGRTANALGRWNGAMVRYRRSRFRSVSGERIHYPPQLFYGVMVSTTGFGPVSGGSSPSGTAFWNFGRSGLCDRLKIYRTWFDSTRFH